MPAQRTGRLQRTTALVPLGLLSAAVTASLVGASPATINASEEVVVPTEVSALPDGTSVPTEAIEAPASVSTGDVVAAGLRGKNAQRVVATASNSDIPSAALAAYQRAETVINEADKSCNVTWQLIAAIGRVESDHGRYGGNVLDDDGVARPGIYGIALNGKRGTALIRDTDAGQFDKDTTYDRAIGPMQFIPSTWSVVGVDADGDGQRDPQDVDDAALGTAVYLCSGDDDLSTTAGQETAVFRYNNSDEYVDLVLSIMDAYMSGDYTSVPTNTLAAATFAPDPTYTPPKPPKPTKAPQPSGSQQGTGSAAPAPAPAPEPAPEPQPTAPAGPVGGGNGGSGGGLGIPGAPTPTLPALPSTSVSVVDEVLSYAQAVLQCTLDGYVDNILSSTDPFDKCVNGYMGK
ncbi:membrane-bound lytic murein transglycosylase B [Nocardioides salarius]|uniref:Membrane-bound lytic murein transglycosylase B n=1 Tax=Nocardioides salarius TaxID=374513 RepID=A0ABS2MC60_9ACTN|nr:lytic murein transglycosylase [Nocardioides salarius]MBM7508773.1 membrane-bound lytic murein transglycosylase B [Nocardioides salarius]